MKAATAAMGFALPPRKIPSCASKLRLPAAAAATDDAADCAATAKKRKLDNK
jgi:hypothetical protein